MAKFEVLIPMCATEVVEVEAEDAGEALAMVEDMVHNNEITFDYDPEDSLNWWAEEKE